MVHQCYFTISTQYYLFSLSCRIDLLHVSKQTGNTVLLPVGSRGRWTSCVRRFPCHSFAVCLALGSCYIPHPPPHHPGCWHTPPPCCAGPPHMELNTGGDRGRERSRGYTFLLIQMYYSFIIYSMVVAQVVQKLFMNPKICGLFPSSPKFLVTCWREPPTPGALRGQSVHKNFPKELIK